MLRSRAEIRCAPQSDVCQRLVDPTTLAGLRIYSQMTGRSVPLGQVATPELVWQPGEIIRRDRLRTVTISSLLVPDATAATVTDALEPWPIRIEREDNGLSAADAVVEAAQQRLRGLAFATLLTLGVVPILYSLFFRVRFERARRRGRPFADQSIDFHARAPEAPRNLPGRSRGRICGPFLPVIAYDRVRPDESGNLSAGGTFDEHTSLPWKGATYRLHDLDRPRQCRLGARRTR